MKRLMLGIIFGCLTLNVQSQSVRNFKVKNESNTRERTIMLDLLRADIKNDIEQDVIFVVNHFVVCGNYAWIEGTAQRKDGKKIVFPDDYYDCCQVQALFTKYEGLWYLEEIGAFSTDVWYSCLADNYEDIDLRIFSESTRSIVVCY